MNPLFIIGCSIAAFSLAGCGTTYFVPMSVAPSKVDTQSLSAEPTGSPDLHVMTHNDGLGWRISGTQAWIEREQRTEQEYWKGLTYQRPKTSIAQAGYTAITVITCPGSLLVHVMTRMYRIFGLFDRAEPTWLNIKHLCVAPLIGMDPTTGIEEVQPGPSLNTIQIQRHVRRPLTEGRLQARWTHPQWDPVGTEYPLTNAPLDIRLRELAPTILRAHSADVLKEGQFELVLISPDGRTSQKPLPIGLSTLHAALVDDLVRRTQQHWPHPMRIRIEATTPQLASFAQTVLTELRLPIVTRGTSATSLQAIHNQEVSPLFKEDLPPAIGHWTGANVLLALTATVFTPTSHLFTVSASAIETGDLLGQFTVEGTQVTDPPVASALRGQLRLLMIPDGPPARRGTFIEEHQ